MALSKDKLKQRIISNLEGLGFASNDYSRFDDLAKAIADAVIDEIQSNAEAVVSGGSSAGSHKVQ